MEGKKLLSQNDRVDLILKKEELRRESPDHFFKVRQALSIFERRDDIIQAIRLNQCVLVKGETGSGKTTQVPQYILEDCLQNAQGSTTNILVIQPRRIAAISVACRISEERGQVIKLTPQMERSVGYEVRFESERPRSVGAITVCTPGILQQLLRYDPDLEEFSHVVLDEVHERDLWTDVLLCVLKIILNKSKLKIIIMSASLDVQMFSGYMDECPVIEVEGRTHLIEEYYLDDFSRDIFGLGHDYVVSSVDCAKELDVRHMAKLIHHIHNKYDIDSGAILVFLPGWERISELEYSLSVEDKNPHWLGDDAVIHTLHSQVDPIQQKEALKPAEKGKRKVILSTNLAETSITIDDVVYVVDSGRINVMKYNVLYKVSNLTLEWICKSSALQRAGRAGRVREGKCWHFFSREQYETLSEYVVPEIKRLQLEEVVLNVLSLGLPIDVKTFLTQMIEPPDEDVVDNAIDLLITIQALDRDQRSLTPLGRKMTDIPLHPLLSKMLILGVIFKCLDPILAIASVLGEKDPFVIGKSKLNRTQLDMIKSKFAKGEKSDHLMLANMMKEWETAWYAGKSTKFCAQNGLNAGVLDTVYKIKKQLLAKLKQSKLISDGQSLAFYNNHSESMGLVKGIIACGLYPQVNPLESDRRGRFLFVNIGNQRLYISKKSVNESASMDMFASYAAYFHARGSPKGTVQIHDCTFLNKHLADLFLPPRYASAHYGAIPEFREKIVSYVDQVLTGKAATTDDFVEDVVRFIEDSNFD